MNDLIMKDKYGDTIEVGFDNERLYVSVEESGECGEVSLDMGQAARIAEYLAERLAPRKFVPGADPEKEVFPPPAPPLLPAHLWDAAVQAETKPTYAFEDAFLRARDLLGEVAAPADVIRLAERLYEGGSR